MHKIQLVISTIALTAILLSACGTAASTPEAMMTKPTDVMMSKPTEAMMDQATATPEAMMSNETATPVAMMGDAATPVTMMNLTATPEGMMDATTPDAMMQAPTWYGASLIDASTGKAFSINDYKGKVVLVETMAVWCTNCKQQQDNIKAFHAQLGMKDNFVTISLDIDPNENQDTLKAYVTKTGFDWMYAVSPMDATREIAKLYGDQFLNPTSTPILIIDRKGVAHPLPFGIKSADDLFKAVDMYLKEGM